MIDIVDLIRRTAHGEPLRLAEGRVMLRSPLVLDRPVWIVGGRTTLVGSSGNAVIVCRANVRLEGLVLERRGKPGNVVLADRGHLAMTGVRMHGGEGERKDNPDLGQGLIVEGRARAVVTRCVVEDNDAVGILVRGQARAEIRECEIRRNFNGVEFDGDGSGEVERCRFDHPANIGVAFADRSRGSVRRCRFVGGRNAFLSVGRTRIVVEENDARACEYSAFAILESSRVRLLRNRAHRSRVSGIHVAGGATATLSGNDLRDNRECGLIVIESARVDADGNTCAGNRELGILYKDRSRGVVRNNVCTGNGWSGFGTVGRAAPRFEGNRAEENREHGFVTGDASRPLLRTNQARKNALAGGWIRGDSAPRLEGNACGENPIGIKIVEQSRPQLFRNTVAGNSHQGIRVEDEARPLLVENDLRNNEGPGIEYWDDSGGVARANRCVGNGHGIEVVGRAEPRLERNVCENNEGEGILLTEDTDDIRPEPTMIDNVCRGNKDEEPIRAPWPALIRKLGRTLHRTLARRAWIPMTQPGEAKGTLSKFGGTAVLAPGESWPACSGCRKPMPLVLQLDLSTIPAEAKRDVGPGLLQFFCCAVDDTDCGDGEGYYRTRILPPRGWVHPKKSPPLKHAVPARRIVGWRLFGEMPRWMDLEAMKRRGVPAAVSKLGLKYFDGDEDLGEGPDASAHLGDKLGGWPCWIHDPDRPACPRCRRPMRDLFQVDSEHSIPWGWGDLGVGWLFQCAEHRDAIAFTRQSH